LAFGLLRGISVAPRVQAENWRSSGSVVVARDVFDRGHTLLTVQLDTIDWRILKELQGDGRMTNIALAGRVGLSAPPCLRRVRALEEAGLISGYSVLLDEAALGFTLTAFAMVGLHNQSEADLRAFENLVLSWPLVREAYMLSGESDFILKCVACDLKEFQDFVLNQLTSATNVSSVKTFLTIARTKRKPGVPISTVVRE